MPDTQSRLDKLRDLIASHPEALQDGAATRDVKDAAAALSRYAAGEGLTVSPAEIEQAFQGRAVLDRAEPLDDDALDKVAGGGGSPWCLLTDGCYCFLTH